jgi:simple sugar transport system ATP-binding protein
MSTNDQPLVRMESIGRTFGNIVALEGIDFQIGYQEVIGLLGDNGAGKSTLIKVLTGVHTPTSGQIYFEGRPVDIYSPQAARELGIETVYQDLALVPLMSIARNFYLGREPTRPVGPFEIIDHETMRQQTTHALEHIGIHIRDTTEPVGTLSGGERQSIAIGRAVHFGTKLLILDEPTSALSIGETRKVLNYTLEAKRRGLSVIFITHNIHHIFEVADRFTIISHGHKTGDFRKEDVTIDEVSGMIMGEPVPEHLRNVSPLQVPTRPITIIIENGSNNEATAEQKAAIEAADTLRRTLAKRRRNNRIIWSLFVVFVAIILGLAFWYSRPKDVTSNQDLTKLYYSTYLAVSAPDGWVVNRSDPTALELASQPNCEAGAKADCWRLTITWGPSAQQGVSPTKPLAEIAKQRQDDDLFGRQFTADGSDFTVGSQPAYRYEWTKASTKRAGIEYIFFNELNYFFEVTAECPADQLATFAPLADAMMKQASFSSK